MHNVKQIIESIGIKYKPNVLSLTSNIKYINSILGCDCNFFLIKNSDTKIEVGNNLYVINGNINLSYQWDCILLLNRFDQSMHSFKQISSMINIPIIMVELNPVSYYFQNIPQGNHIPKRFLESIKRMNIDIEVFQEREIMNQWETNSKKYLINTSDELSFLQSWNDIFNTARNTNDET